MKLSSLITATLVTRAYSITDERGNNLHRRFHVRSIHDTSIFPGSTESRHLQRRDDVSGFVDTCDQAAPTSITSSRAYINRPAAVTTAAVPQAARIGDEGWHPGATVSGDRTSVNATSSNVGYGICYDMINDASECKSAEAIGQDISFLSGQGFKLVRTYDNGCDIGALVANAAAQGMKVFAGINNVAHVVDDLAILIRYIDSRWDSIDTINIGNEEILHGRASSEVIDALVKGRAVLRDAGFNGTVVTTDTVAAWTAELVEASDYVAANVHGYFDSSNTAENTGTWLQRQYDMLTDTAGQKRVVITESGWPHEGSTNGAAVPGVLQQEAAIRELKKAFSNKQDSLYLFQSSDAMYKQPGPYGVERSFGIYHANQSHR